jgi:hypothetical protein
MKKFLLFLFWILLYFVFFWIQVVIAIGLNFAFFERGDGGITGLGSIIAFWTSYIIVKAIRSRILNKKAITRKA